MSDWRHRFAEGFRNAFDIGPKGPVAPTPKQRETVDRILAIVVRRRLTTPTIIFLESTRPLNSIGAATIHFFEPIASTLVDREAMRDFAAYLENRGSIDWLIQRLEALEADSPKNPEK